MTEYSAVIRKSEQKIIAISEDEDFINDICDTFNEEDDTDEYDYDTITFEAPDNIEEMEDSDETVETEYGALTYADIAEAIKRSNEDDGSADEIDIEDLGESLKSSSENW